MLRILYGCGWSSGKSRIAESGPALFFSKGFGYCRYGCRYDWGFVFHVKHAIVAVAFIWYGFERLCKLADFSTMGITCGKPYLPIIVLRETFYMYFIQAAAVVSDCHRVFHVKQIPALWGRSGTGKADSQCCPPPVGDSDRYSIGMFHVKQLRKQTR